MMEIRRFQSPEIRNYSNHTGELKIEIMNLLLENDDIVKCLADNTPQFLDCDISTIDRYGLLYNNIFPYQAIPDIQTKEQSYITMAFRFDKDETKWDYKVGRLYMYLFCHKNLVRTDYGILRYDFLEQRIEEELLHSRGPNWLGQMYLERQVDTIIDSGGFYVGTELQWRFTDFM